MKTFVVLFFAPVVALGFLWAELVAHFNAGKAMARYFNE